MPLLASEHTIKSGDPLLMNETEQVTVRIHVRDDAVVISDHGEEGPSARDSIESVLDQLYARNPDAPRVVLFRDNAGEYEGVAVDEDGEFTGFYPLQTRDTEHAVAVAYAWIVEAPSRFH